MQFRDRDTRKEEMRNFGKRVEEALLNGDDELFTRYLKLAATAGYKYSPANTFLIMIQKPTSRLVLSLSRAHKLAEAEGHKGWKKTGKYGDYTEYVHPAKDSKAAFVWCPRTFNKTEKDANGEDQTVSGVYFVPGDVWAIEDLVCFDTKQSPECPDFVPDLDNAEDLYDALCAVALDRGLTPKEEAIGGGARGFLSGTNVTVDLRDSVGKKCAVMAHELSHGVLGHWEAKDETPQRLLEAEAELSAAIVLACFGYDVVSASAFYLRSYKVTPEDLRASLKRIQKTAEDVADAVKAKLDERVTAEVA